MELEIEFKGQEIREQTTKKGNQLHWQRAGITGQGDWPIVFDVFCGNGQPHPVGKHRFIVALKADQWGGLEINPFDCKVLPLETRKAS